MKWRVTIKIIICLVVLGSGTNSARAVDYQDYRTPIIQEIKQNYVAVYENGENFLEINYEIKVKTFSNLLSGAMLSYVYSDKDYPVGCQLIPTNWGGLTVSYGDNTSKLDSLTQPSGLVKVEKFNGYQIETHNFNFTTKVMRSSLNTKFKFCDQTLKLEMVSLWDNAGHMNSINYNHSNYFGTFYNTYPEIPYQSFKTIFTQKQLPNDFCQNLTVPYDWYTSEKLYSVCNHSNSLATLSISLTPSQNDLAKAAADKAAADKAAADKAAADKAAADKAAADKAAAESKSVADSRKATIDNLNAKLMALLIAKPDLKLVILKAQNSLKLIKFSSSANEDFAFKQQLLPIEKQIQVLEKMQTITCTKGKVTKKVTAVRPKCPVGYRKR